MRTFTGVQAAELHRDGLLPEDADVTSVEQLLDTLEGSSGLVAESLVVPPLNVDDIRASWQSLRQRASELPDRERTASLYGDLQHVAEQEGRSLRSVSSLVAASAVRAGVQMGQVHIFDYYQQALQSIHGEGLTAYDRRVTQPYLSVSRGHFDRERVTYTERLVQWLRRLAEPPRA